MGSKAVAKCKTREFEPTDAAAVHNMLLALASARGRFESNIVLRESFVQHFPAYVKAVTQGGRGTVRIAEVDGNVGGMAIATEAVRDPWLPNERSAELRAIYVDPAHRGVGAAGLLVEDVVAWASGRKLDVVSVHAFADHPEEAEALKSMGFQEYRIQLERRVTQA